MKRGRKCVVVLLALLFCLSAVPTYAAENDSSINRFNVMFVLDASNSMNTTDPNTLRYEAIRQFTNLLAQEGNYLGGVVYSNKVEALQSPALVTTQAGKDATVALLESFQSTGVSSTMGYTNTGDALYLAVEELQAHGNPDLPSVIVLLSDGNSEMPTEEELLASETQKAEAVELARKQGIEIYSVCLNANYTADVTEMEQISSATGGEFREVNTPQDLQSVLDAFYTMVYGIENITLLDGSFSSDGSVTASFEVPGAGVEEINIIIYGTTTDVELTKPDGTQANIDESKSSLSTFIKVTDVQPGTWNLVAYGSPKDSIKINMVYNTNLGVDVDVDADLGDIRTQTPFTVNARLMDGAIAATTSSKYVGYEATLHLKDAYGEELDAYTMALGNGCFMQELSLDQGVYYLSVTVESEYVQRTSADVGPVTVADEVVPPNTAPVTVEDTVEKKVYILPFKDASMELDLTTLATDGEDSSLVYRIVSSSFMEGSDYTLDQNQLSVHNFSLSKGSFDVQATDSGGLSCHIDVVVSSYNVGLMALIGMGIGALIALIVFGAGLYIALNKPFRGTITAQSYCNGSYRGIARTPSRGRCKLSMFQTEPVGLELTKCYFQASGKRYITLVLNKKIKHQNQLTDKIRIESGIEMQIFPNEGNVNGLVVRFESRIPQQAARPRGRRR